MKDAKGAALEQKIHRYNGLPEHLFPLSTNSRVFLFVLPRLIRDGAPYHTVYTTYPDISSGFVGKKRGYVDSICFKTEILKRYPLKIMIL
jgi:hypothetical protein